MLRLTNLLNVPLFDLKDNIGTISYDVDLATKESEIIHIYFKSQMARVFLLQLSQNGQHCKNIRHSISFFFVLKNQLRL